MDFYGFYTGQEFEAYKYLGAHYTKERTTFRTFAPSAAGVELVLNGQGHGMQRVHDGNFYEITLDQVKEGDLYEFRIWHRDGSCQEHCDPYGFGMELRPAHKSVVRDLNRYAFTDEKWLKDREDISTKPLNIYEVHAGSFKKPGTGQTDWYTYEELGEVLIPYLKESGYNCVEFLPLSEHPCDESWGYQNTGFFAPTARYGTAEGLQKLVDQMHQNGIYVLLDFVPVHFATDDYGLKRYDGGELYEYPSRDVGVSEWGSCNFMHSRGEVRCFLQSAAYYWMKEFHFDGIRMDAISRIIYWQGDERRGVNGNAVDFIRFMNKGLKERVPNCILAAEDSTNFPGVTAPADQGGLGFDYKWDMGWMNDMLHYMSYEHQRTLLLKCADRLRSQGMIIIRDGNSANASKHRLTRFTELLSTRIFNFNRTTGELYFTTETQLREIAVACGMAVEIIPNDKYTSNTIYIFRKPN